MTPAEIERFARAIAAIRPDWPLKSLTTALTNFTHAHPHRSYPDTAHALLELALDPATKNPGRLAEDGPWWKARPGKGDNPRPVTSGPEARFCREPIANEDGTPSTCNRLIHPDETHTCRRPPGARTELLTDVRQQLADAQGVHQRVEGEREQRREEARA